MDFTSHDIAIIERALQVAMNKDDKESRITDYREVLLKLQSSAKQVMNSSSMSSEDYQDGIRYDYDDSSDLL